MKVAVRLWLAMIVSLGFCERTLAQGEDSGFGVTPEEAIEVCRDEGQRTYLNLLRCPDGSEPDQNRVGNMGERNYPETQEEEDLAWDQSASYDPLPEGVKDFHVLEMYTLECGDDVYALYFDNYHCDGALPTMAPPGLQLSADGASNSNGAHDPAPADKELAGHQASDITEYSR